jgi:fructan beta-fructosidase
MEKMKAILFQIVCCLAAPPGTLLVVERPDILVADFEWKDYGDWKVTGEAFGPGPARGTLPDQMHVDGFLGKGLVNSYHGGDVTTGTITSPQFKIERRFIRFLIGGGKYPGKTCMNLLVDGKIVRTATGPNDKPGGSERLDWHSWDVSDLIGKAATIEIVDQATGGWGHINVDHIVQTDRKPPTILNDVMRELVIQKRYLNLPVRNGAAKRRMSFTVEGRTEREFEIELADAEPDFWVFLDVSQFQDKKAVIQVDRLPEDSAGFESIEQSESIRGADELYRERLRPQFHFSSRRGWNNDPNGMVYYKGEYHLYYQHNPYGWSWGNMHWGHAISRDLVHWEELPIAIYPRQFGDWVFSGSAVVDWKNTSVFRAGSDDVLVAAYTSTGRGECIAYSNDRGRTWTDYDGNPVVKHLGRDPRLFWHEPTGRWVMAVYNEGEKKQNVDFYTSPDLKAWKFQSRIEGFYECPDIFELPVDGDAANKKWVLTAASSEYMIGTFDGKSFTPETPKLPGHRGNAFYAAQTFSDIPPTDGRCIQIGWGQMATPGMPFNQMMCFPCELTLRTTPDGIRLHFEPVKELSLLRAKTHRVSKQPLKPGDNPLADVRGELFDIHADLELGDANEIGLRVRGTAITYDTKTQELVCLNRRAPLKPTDGRIRLQVLADRTSLEIFGGDGLVYMPMAVTTTDDDRSVALSAKGGTATIRSVELHELKSIWMTR